MLLWFTIIIFFNHVYNVGPSPTLPVACFTKTIISV